MAVPQSSRPGELEEAFGLFNRMSEQLSASYRLLEQRVAQLSAELVEARAARERSHDESTRLANRLQHLLSALPAGVVVLDILGRIQDHNPAAAELLGLPLRGASWMEIISRAFDPRPRDGHEISLKDGRLVSVATRALDPEPGQLVLITDLTATRELQDALARNERLSAMGEMVASLAHQVRTPLATALLYASQLGRAALSDADRERMAERILERLRNLERQVSDMLLFARGGAAILEPLALAGLIDGLAQTLAPQLAASGCRLHIDNRAPDAVLAANREALTGALLNLLENAITVCSGSGEIVLEIESADAAIDIRVRDNGPGIAPEIAARVFEPFFTTRASGTGLGLAVVQAVAQAHGGTVWVESAPGEGATFGLRLPVRKSQVSSSKSQAENPESVIVSSNRNSGDGGQK